MSRLDQDIEYISGEADRIAGQALREAGMDASAIGGDVEHVYANVRDQISKGLTAAGEVRGAEGRIADRDYPLAPGDIPGFRDKATSSRFATEASFKAADTGITVLKSLLLVGAMPRIEGAEFDRAAKEVEMLLEGSRDPMTKMTELAKGSDRRLAAVVTSSWGLARLRGDNAAHHAIQLQALGAAAQHGTPLEQRHAQAFTRMTSNLGKNLAVARVRANQTMAAPTGPEQR
jgi:hypothetical protein